MALTITFFSFRVGFSYIVRIICDGLCTLSKYRSWILIVCWLLPLYKTPAFDSPIGTKIGDLLQYMTVGQLSFPLVSISALFDAQHTLHSASLLRLSVRPSVCQSLIKCVLGVARSFCGSWASVTLPDAGQFSTFFYHQTLQHICNKDIIKDTLNVSLQILCDISGMFVINIVVFCSTLYVHTYIGISDLHMHIYIYGF